MQKKEKQTKNFKSKTQKAILDIFKIYKIFLKKIKISKVFFKMMLIKNLKYLSQDHKKI